MTKQITKTSMLGAMHTTPTGAMEAFTGLPPLVRQDQQQTISGVWNFGPTFTPFEDIVAY